MLVAIISFIISTILLFTCGAGLGVIIKFPYLDPLSHRVESVCLVTNCYIGEGYRCGHRNSKICYDTHYDYTLSYNSTNYTKTFYGTTYNHGVCDNAAVTCYYDDRDPITSFTTDSYIEATLGIILMSMMVILFLMGSTCLLTYIIVMIINKHKVEYVN